MWLARNVLSEFRAVKIVYRRTFDHDRPYEREFEGIKKYEPISRTHDSQVDILHVGRNDEAGLEGPDLSRIAARLGRAC